MPECIICITVLAGIFASYIFFSHIYYKNKSIRENQLEQVVTNINSIESIRSKVNDLESLYNYYISTPNAEIYLIGSGKCEIIKDGEQIRVKIIDNAENDFIPIVQSSPRLFRIVLSGNDIYSKMSTVIRIGGRL